jgi:methylmalonyl-CoA/ethylmalonyl-CoA epimerase
VDNTRFSVNRNKLKALYLCTMQQVDHIGIAVKALNSAIPIFEKLLNTPCYKTELVEGEKVNTAFFATGQTKVELLESTDDTGVIARFIEKKGEGLHHIAFAVDDIEVEMARLKAEGFQLLSESPKPGADNKLVCFLHPKDTNGVLIEICQSREQ